MYCWGATYTTHKMSFCDLAVRILSKPTGLLWRWVGNADVQWRAWDITALLSRVFYTAVLWACFCWSGVRTGVCAILFLPQNNCSSWTVVFNQEELWHKLIITFTCAVKRFKFPTVIIHSLFPSSFLSFLPNVLSKLKIFEMQIDPYSKCFLLSRSL